MKSFIPLLGLVLALNSCAPKVYQSVDWQTKPVVVDGSMDEWPNPLRFYDSNSKVNYAISNDRKNIYFCFKVVDKAMQMRIMHAGMTIKIDTAGGKKFPISIALHSGANPMAQHDFDPFQDQSMPKAKGAIASKGPKFGEGEELAADLDGFKPAYNGHISFRKGGSGIQAAAGVDKSGTMHYEVALPLATFYRDSIALGNTPLFSITILFNGLKMDGHERGDAPGGGRGREMGGGMAGGGMHGGHGGGRPGGGHGDFPGGGSNMSSDLKIEHQLRLSSK